MADIQELFKEAWSQALVGINAAETEAEKVLQRLVDAAGISPEDMRKHAREFGERLGAQRQELERSIDDAVRRAAQVFKLPTREDLDLLKQRLDALDQRIDAMAREKEKQA